MGSPYFLFFFLTDWDYFSREPLRWLHPLKPHLLPIKLLCSMWDLQERPMQYNFVNSGRWGWVLQDTWLSPCLSSISFAVTSATSRERSLIMLLQLPVAGWLCGEVGGRAWNSWLHPRSSRERMNAFTLNIPFASTSLTEYRIQTQGICPLLSGWVLPPSVIIVKTTSIDTPTGQSEGVKTTSGRHTHRPICWKQLLTKTLPS